MRDLQLQTLTHATPHMQAAVAILQEQGLQPPEEGSSGSGQQSRRQRGPNQAFATASQASSQDSFSESVEIDSGKVDMQKYHPPRIPIKDVSAELIPPAERYSEWISRNVHGQEQHSLASLVKREGSPPVNMPILTPVHANRAPPGCGATSGSTQVCSGESCMHQLQSGCDTAEEQEPKGKQACSTTERGRIALGESTGIKSSGGRALPLTSPSCLMHADAGLRCQSMLGSFSADLRATSCTRNACI